MSSPVRNPALSMDREPPGEAGGGSIEELEGLLEHCFARRELLRRALTHRSLAHEHNPQERSADEATALEEEAEDNERLEFLGDAVVGLVAAESVYRRYPDLPEGALTRLRGALVNRGHLAEVAEGLDLGKYLLLGRGEERSGGRAKTALLANAMEAVIGALYLDGGLEAVRRLIETQVIAPVVTVLREQLTAGGGMGDFKSALQELLQARKQGQPEYRITAESGPDHRKQFFVEARLAGETLAEGVGRSRKHAEQDAARHAIHKLHAAGNEAGEAE